MPDKDSEIYLVNCPLDLENNHTYYFESAEAQLNFFKNKKIKYLTNYSYLRKENKISLHTPYEEIKHCNYVVYRNPSYENKWYYAFVKELNYINDGLTELIIETDVMQTYLFDYSVGQCFVEREHVDNDAVGLHTIPEGLETGEYVGDYIEATQDSNSKWLSYNISNCCSVVAVSELISPFMNYLGNYNPSHCDIPTGLYYIGCQTNTDVRNLIRHYDSKGKGDAIQYIFIAPKHHFGSSFDEFNFTDIAAQGYYQYLLSYEKSGICWFYKPTQLNGYSPRNNKLLTYPYSYFTMSNNSGSVIPYMWEHFANPDDLDKIQFRCIEGLAPGGSIKVFPQYYKGKSANYDEGISYGKLPIGCWTSDVHTNWLTQNGVNNAFQNITSIASIVGGIGITAVSQGLGSAVGLGMITSGISGVAQNMVQKYQHSITPDQARGNTNLGDVNYQYSLTGIKFSNMSIKSEYAKIIDRYFDMYGYKVNNIKIPNKNHRESYWYTKTIEANITGNLPQNDLQKIINNYNKGITFWKSDHAFRNYTQENLIV